MKAKKPKPPKEAEEENKPAQKKPGNQYDNIIKKNLDDVFLPLIELHFGIQIIAWKQEKTNMHRTSTKRSVDGFYWIWTYDEEEFLLHLEFQSSDEPQMIFRVNEYISMIRVKYPNATFRSIVFYMGAKKKPNMRTKLYDHEIFRGFELINFRNVSTTDYLTSDKPGMVIMAILTDFEKKEAENIIRLILHRLLQLKLTENVLNDFIDQLIIISKLRKLVDITQQIVETMPITVDFSDTALYQDGYALGKAESEQRIKEERKKVEERNRAIIEERNRVIIQERKRTAEERKKRMEERRKRMEERKIAEKEKDSIIIKFLKSDLATVEEIAKILNLPLEYVKKIEAKMKDSEF